MTITLSNHFQIVICLTVATNWFLVNTVVYREMKGIQSGLVIAG